jgi:hypothetical protein
MYKIYTQFMILNDFLIYLIQIFSIKMTEFEF